MRLHASCAARAFGDGGDAVLFTGPPGSGKSDLVLRLIHAGWSLVADDQVIVEDGFATAPTPLSGVLEVRGLGLFRLDCLARARLRLVVRCGFAPDRLPSPERDPMLGLPVVWVDPGAVSEVERVSLALEAARGRLRQLAGAFSS
jgi:HPr kinase/phosphorylase